MQDDPRRSTGSTLLLTFLYKFARHEWVGISAAWDATPAMTRVDSMIEKISRYHLCEEFCHMRLFHEMFRTFRLDGSSGSRSGKWMGRMYRRLPAVPGARSWLPRPS